ncbi:MAG: hypothetical protein ABSA13_03695 [Beijerinckiaceae bacterium]|jgi:hypothetical protein
MPLLASNYSPTARRWAVRHLRPELLKGLAGDCLTAFSDRRANLLMRIAQPAHDSIDQA